MGDRRTHWRSWFASTGEPPAWALVGYMVCGLVVGASLAAALPEVRGTLLAGLAGVVVAASGSGGPSGISRRVALMAAGLGLIVTFVAFATGNRPVWAAAAMAVVALGTSLAAAAGPLGAVLGFLGLLVLPRGDDGPHREPVRPGPAALGNRTHRRRLTRRHARRLRRHGLAETE
jgi:hypothetical protein